MALDRCFVLVLLIGLAQCQFEFERERERDLDVPSRDQTAEGCYGKVADVFIALDSSTSIYINDYKQQLQFARDLVARLDVGQRATRVGLLTFSDDITRPVLELSRSLSKSDVLASINEQNLPYRTGVTNTDQAIRYIRENGAARDGVTKIIIVITDGGSRSPWNTAREAQLAREQGFYLYVIGVGQYQDEREWKNIANDPDESFVFNVTNYRVLDQVKYSLPSRACALPPQDLAKRCNFARNADVFFVAGPAGNQDALQLIERVVEASTDNNNYVRASYLLGSCSNAENVQLANPNNYCDRFQSPAQGSGETFVQLLARVRSISRQSRRGTKQLAVLFIDEETVRINRYGLQTEVRNVANGDNVEIIIVDLGVRGYGNIIQALPLSRDNLVTFTQGGVTSQRTAINSLVNRLCSVIHGEDYTYGYTQV